MLVKAEFVNPFLVSASQVLQTETGTQVTKGEVYIEDSPLESDEVTVLIGVVGRVQGLVLYGMTEQTGRNLVAAMTGEEVPVFDAMCESAVAELGNVITGLASGELEAAGYPCKIAPPSVVVGKGTSISTLSIKRLVIPLETSLGSITVHVALREVY
ncbi:MAG: chemotaxis protein CheX [Symbiobacterium sp.]|uniref:chemotaxis protein CheX n=1 Tax=Symbiobacterium sp. TaxID=1971213 RepID=UPI0034648F92